MHVATPRGSRPPLQRRSIAVSIAVGVAVASLLVPTVVLSSWNTGIEVSSYRVDSLYVGPYTVWAGAVAIGLRSTNAPGPLPSLPLRVGPHENLTAMWQVACGGNASFVCNVSSLRVDSPFELVYSPLGSNTPWVWSGISGGQSAIFEEVYLLGPTNPGSYTLTISITVTETVAR